MLTLQDIKTLESLFIVEMHSAERIFRLIETGMETIYHLKAWMFGNCKLEISPNELKKPLKSGANNKIDGVHALLDAMYLFDYVEGQIQV